MRKMLSFVVAVSCLIISASARPAAQQPRPGATQPPQVEDVLKIVREELQADRADVIAKNLTLTSDQAARFWPVFAKYQEAQNAIMDEQIKGIQTYVDQYDKLDDAGALTLINAHFDRDTRMNALRQKWLFAFQEVLPTRVAVRVMQIDRRLSLVHQIGIASRIPLVR